MKAVTSRVQFARPRAKWFIAPGNWRQRGLAWSIPTARPYARDNDLPGVPDSRP